MMEEGTCGFGFGLQHYFWTSLLKSVVLHSKFYQLIGHDGFLRDMAGERKGDVEAAGRMCSECW